MEQFPKPLTGIPTHSDLHRLVRDVHSLQSIMENLTSRMEEAMIAIDEHVRETPDILARLSSLEKTIRDLETRKPVENRSRTKKETPDE